MLSRCNRQYYPVNSTDAIPSTPPTKSHRRLQRYPAVNDKRDPTDATNDANTNAIPPILSHHQQRRCKRQEETGVLSKYALD